MSGDGIELLNGTGRATIARRGAELTSWRACGIETIWTPDPAVWDRTSPILFPVVGWCRDAQIRVAGEFYPMGVHGFAAQQDFDIVEQTANSVTMLLQDNATTRRHYPFAFELSVTYALTEATMAIALNVRNNGDEDMPFGCGLHPGFRWPLFEAERKKHFIEFGAFETPRVPIIAPGGLFAADTRAITLEGRRLPINDETFAQEALCFLNARSQSLDYGASEGARLHARFENFPHLAIWSKPGAPFVSIEAWTSHGDPVGFWGDIYEKPSMIVLQPGTSSVHKAEFSLDQRASNGIV